MRSNFYYAFVRDCFVTMFPAMTKLRADCRVPIPSRLAMTEMEIKLSLPFEVQVDSKDIGFNFYINVEAGVRIIYHVGKIS